MCFAGKARQPKPINVITMKVISMKAGHFMFWYEYRDCVPPLGLFEYKVTIVMHFTKKNRGKNNPETAWRRKFKI